MISFDVKYTNYNGLDVQETLLFHISKKDLLLSDDDSYDKLVETAKRLSEQVPAIQQLEKKGDEDFEPFSDENRTYSKAVRLVAKLLDQVVDLAYGKKSPDGLRFVKNDEILRNFKDSLAYETFIDTLLTEPDRMTAFVNKLVGNVK